MDFLIFTVIAIWVFTIGLNVFSKKALFGTEIKEIGQIKPKSGFVKTTIGVHTLSKKDQFGDNLIGIELRQHSWLAFRIQKFEIGKYDAKELSRILEEAAKTRL